MASATSPPSDIRAACARASYRLARIVEIVASALVVVVTALVVTQVIFRYVLETPLSWSEELARYTGIWAAFLGAAVGLRSKAHFRVVYFVNLLPPRARHLIDRGVTVVLFVFLVAIVAATIPLLGAVAVQRSAAARIPLVLVYAALPVSNVLMIAFIVLDTIAGSTRPLPSELAEPEGTRPPGIE